MKFITFSDYAVVNLEQVAGIFSYTSTKDTRSGTVRSFIIKLRLLDGFEYVATFDNLHSSQVFFTQFQGELQRACADIGAVRADVENILRATA
jgi:hypothetical protein